jgi:uncharacterized SAM-binding protein YcdF (DUF218 family)
MMKLYGLLQILLTPLMFPCLALLMLFAKNKVGSVLAKIFLSLFFLLSIPIIENFFVSCWEPDFSLETVKIAENAPQAIVVLGGGLTQNAAEYGDSATLKIGTLLRVRYAAKLSKQTGLPVLTSGGQPDKNVNISEARAMAKVLREEFGVSDVYLEEQSLNTAENASFSRKVLQPLGIDRIILVTQAYHMPRSENEFLKAGFQVLIAPTAFFRKNNFVFPLDFLPSIKALEIESLLLHETVGMLWYKIKSSTVDLK